MSASEQNKSPLVSILMNCYNGETYLSEALESVLAQTHENWEIIFWDNQSTDKSSEIFKAYKDVRFKYYYASKHTDLGGGRAAAWPEIKGDYLVILDTDDTFEPKKIEHQVKFMLANPAFGVTFSNTRFFTNSRNWLLYQTRPPVEAGLPRLIERYYVSLESVMISMHLAKQQHIAFDRNFSHIADFDLIVRLAAVSKIGYLDEVLSNWRVHMDSGSWAEKHVFYEEIMKWGAVRSTDSLLKDYQCNISRLVHRAKLRLAAHRILSGEIKAAIEILNVPGVRCQIQVLTVFLFYFPIYIGKLWIDRKLTR